MRPSDLVVVESGANWTQWMKARGSGCPVIAVLQMHEEGALDFATRVRAQLDWLGASGSPIGRFTIVGGEAWDIPGLQARLAILRSARDFGLPADAVELHLQVAQPPRSASDSRSRA